MLKYIPHALSYKLRTLFFKSFSVIINDNKHNSTLARTRMNTYNE